MPSRPRQRRERAGKRAQHARRVKRRAKHRVRLVRKGKRRVAIVRNVKTGHTVVVKSNVNIREARRESEVMRTYGDSPYLVRIYRYRVRRGRGYIVMEHVRGRTLRALIRRYGAFRPQTAVAITLSILKGLEELHNAGYVHGDLHCGNVVVYDLPQRAVKLIDMQHAVRKRADGRAFARRRLPRPPAKLPPETRQRWIDDSYDIYGAGFILACMLRGRELLRRPAALRARPQHALLWDVVRKATARSPARRYHSAQLGSRRTPRATPSGTTPIGFRPDCG